MSELAERYTQVKQRIHETAKRCERDVNDIALLAVSKRKPAEDIVAMHALGQQAFGENYVQEGVDKITSIAIDDISWHFIGHIQSNKTKDIAQHFDWVHGLEKLKHAKRLSSQRPENKASLQVCIQVSITGEESKGGVSPDALPDLAKAVAELPNIRLRGLMTMPDPNTSREEQRKVFTALRQCKEQLNEQGLELDTLSMGMSGDMEDAIAEGSTMIRIGTALFGKRD